MIRNKTLKSCGKVPLKFSTRCTCEFIHILTHFIFYSYPPSSCSKARATSQSLIAATVYIVFAYMPLARASHIINWVRGMLLPQVAAYFIWQWAVMEEERYIFVKNYAQALRNIESHRGYLKNWTLSLLVL